MKQEVSTEKKRPKMINSFALIFLIIIFVAILTVIVPAGQFDRVEGEDGRMRVVSGTFHYIDQTPSSPWDVFMAVPEGVIATAGMVVCTLIIGGGIEVIQATGALNIGISKGISRFHKKGGDLALIFLFIIFSTLGGFMGFGEASLPFYPIAIAIAVGLGYDSLTGVAIAFLGSMVGFIAGPLNQSNVGIPQSIAGLPLYSGMPLRLVLFVVMVTLGLHHVLRYAKKIKNNPEYSLMKDIDVSDLNFNVDEYNKEKFTAAHIAIIIVLIGGMVLFSYNALYSDWWLNELSATFVVIAVLAGIIGRVGINKTCEAFMEGVAGISGGAMLIGMAGGIQFILNDGNIMDTIIHAVATPLSGMPPIIAAIGMFFVIAIINLFIPSGSAKAVAIMPIILPAASLIGVSQQTAILAYQLGDGITNFIAPTLGMVFIALAFGRVPYDRWIRFCLPLIWKIAVVGVIFVSYGVITNYGPF